MTKIIYVLAFLIVYPITAFAQASCDVDIINAQVDIAWDSTFQYKEVQFQINKLNEEECSIRIGFTKGAANSYARNAIAGTHAFPYQIYKDNAFVTPLKDGLDVLNYDETINVSFPEGTNTSKIVSYFIRINPADVMSPQYVKSGSYSDTFEIRTYDSEILNTPTDIATISLDITMPKILDISLAPAGGSFDPNSVASSVDFGNLEYSRTVELDLLVRTNAGYKISMASENNGRLKNVRNNDEIPYNLFINNLHANLTTSFGVVESFSGESGEMGLANRIKIITQQASNVTAGDYTDRISIIIEPND